LKISIITISFNAKATIEKTLKSVANQSYNNIEHIIVDGASTDGTLSLLESNRDQLKALISEPDKGIYDAMNKGIKIATGDIIGFLNSDDFYSRNDVLSKVAKVFIKNPSLDGCYADLIYTARFDTSKHIRYWRSNEFIQGSFSKGWCPPHPTFFVRSSVYKKFGNFNLNYSIASDVELMMRLLEIKKINVSYIPELWVKMRIGGLSNKSLKNIIKVNKEIICALKSHNLHSSSLIFFIHKIISRLKQFFLVV
jgi:glycosyltransferase involved in cell wall biosynthesis